MRLSGMFTISNKLDYLLPPHALAIAKPWLRGDTKSLNGNAMTREPISSLLQETRCPLDKGGILPPVQGNTDSQGSYFHGVAKNTR